MGSSDVANIADTEIIEVKTLVFKLMAIVASSHHSFITLNIPPDKRFRW